MAGWKASGDEERLRVLLGRRPDLTPEDVVDQFPGRSLQSLVHKVRRLREPDDGRRAPHQPPAGTTAADRERRLGRIADLLERSGIDPEDVARVDKIRLGEYQGMYKDADDEAHVVDMTTASVLLSPTWEDGPAWPVVQPGPVLAVARRSPPPVRAGRLASAVILPDAQIGYYRDTRGVLHPTHDEAALDVALQLVGRARPDRIILLGDNLDFPELSRYRREPAFAATTQATIDRATTWLADLRAQAGAGASIDWIEGNHDVRVSTYIKDNASAAFGLRQGNTPASWPVMSVPFLCRFDQVDATYHPGYPASHVWLSDRLRCIHGWRAQKSSNAYPYLNEERVSTIYAHTHRREWAERTRQSRHGPRVILAASPGALCRVDGAVPGTKTGYDLDGLPITSYQDWQQGAAVVHYTADDGPFFFEMVPIHDGQAYYQGEALQAAVGVEGAPLDQAVAA